MPVLFTNNASAPLAASISSSATTIVVTTGQGALFPALSGSDYFYATLTNSSNQLEIVKVTARSSDTMTVVRGQEGTTARAYSAADKIEIRVTAAGLTNMAQLDKTQTFSVTPTFTNPLAVASGGTGVTTSTGSGANVLATSPTLVTPVLGTPTSGNLANCTFPTLNQNTTGTANNVTGIVAVANGGTGLATLTANNVLLGNGTSTPLAVAPGTTGNVLASNGTTWVSISVTPDVQTFTSTGTWTKPTGGQTMARIQVWGGGAGGGQNVGTGGGGAYNELTVPLSFLAATVTATVGAGGAGAGGSSTGGTGGNSSFALATSVNGRSAVTAFGGHGSGYGGGQLSAGGSSGPGTPSIGTTYDTNTSTLYPLGSAFAPGGIWNGGYGGGAGQGGALFGGAGGGDYNGPQNLSVWGGNGGYTGSLNGSAPGGGGARNPFSTGGTGGGGQIIITSY
jgi:hypothetical protein